MPAEMRAEALFLCPYANADNADMTDRDTNNIKKWG